jgi:thioredoxin 1
MMNVPLTIRSLVHRFANMRPILGLREKIMTAAVTDSSFDADVLKSNEPVVVDFWAEWCGPCRMIAPALEDISKEMAGKVKIVKLNVDENPGVAAQYGIRSIPTLMIFKGGALAAQKVGASSKNDLSKWISSSV